MALALLLAGCSAESARQSTPTPNVTAAAPATAAPTTVEAPPGPGASVSAVADWGNAGTPVDQRTYRPTVSGDPDPRETEGVIAFTSPSGKMSCDNEGDRVFCDVRLLDPPPRPAAGTGNWESGWIGYDAKTAGIGGFAGGIRVGWGPGPVLPYGSRVTFPNYACRLEPSGLTCVDPAANTGVRINDSGIVPFGCLRRLPDNDPEHVRGGVEFSC
jgi:hypothetical protein